MHADNCKQQIMDFVSGINVCNNAMSQIQTRFKISATSKVAGSLLSAKTSLLSASKKIISSSASKKISVALLQLNTHKQVSSPDIDSQLLRQRVENVLTSTAQKFKSSELSNLAMKMDDEKVGMEKVKKLIQNMIIRLKEQATSEQSAEAKCAADLADISKNKEDHELNLKQKKAQLEQKEASTELNTEAISNLGSELREVQFQHTYVR